jgi:hypothetical protein
LLLATGEEHGDVDDVKAGFTYIYSSPFLLCASDRGIGGKGLGM